MFFRSERLFLRPAWPEDWQDVLAGMGDEAILRNLASPPWPCTTEDAKAFVRRPHERGLPNFCITLPTGGGARLIGGIGLARRGEGAELGFWIARPHWGQGYASEAARAIVGLARALGHRGLGASHFLDNPAAGRVLRKAGFVPTGKVRRRFGTARGGEAPARDYALRFGCDGGCDDDPDIGARQMEAA